MTTDTQPDIFGEVEALLPSGWYISAVNRFEDEDTGEIWWGASAESLKGMHIVEENGEGATAAHALRDLVRRLSD